MSPRIPLADLRRHVLAELDSGTWATASDIAGRLRLGHGVGWLKVALILERAAVDGDAEIQRPGRNIRRFRRLPT
jgi:hypothetical protein